MEDIFKEVPFGNEQVKLNIAEKRDCKDSEVGQTGQHSLLEKRHRANVAKV